jgi:hypothetical protein
MLAKRIRTAGKVASMTVLTLIKPNQCPYLIPRSVGFMKIL